MLLLKRYVWIVFVCLNSTFKLCHIIDLSELAENLDYETNAKRVQNREKLLGILSQK
jgi:crotonobetainyl-CoA:carnitine CoA-transferase CaiB-like acyl-CoA transferase